MTLIIGCITPEFGIIAGDAQLTVGSNDYGNVRRRETQLKLNNPSEDLIFGIMGNWSSYIPDEHNNNKVYIDNQYLNLCENVEKSEEKLNFLKQFVLENDNINGTVIYVNKTKDRYELDSVSSNDEGQLSSLSIGNINFLFNEPIASINSAFVLTIIQRIHEEQNLGESFEDVLFLLNNSILEIIAKGYSFSTINNEGTNSIGILNSVGGFVTISALTSENGRHNFSVPYKKDFKTLLDCITHPFSKFVDLNSKIRYVDNLSMLVQNLSNPFNDSIRENLLSLIGNQINFVARNKIMEPYVINKIVKHINKKYDLKITKIKADKKDDQDTLYLGDLILDAEEKEIKISYLKSFF